MRYLAVSILFNGGIGNSYVIQCEEGIFLELFIYQSRLSSHHITLSEAYASRYINIHI